jgi:predicted RNase H-like nuclease
MALSLCSQCFELAVCHGVLDGGPYATCAVGVDRGDIVPVSAIGVDACRAGWVAVELSDGEFTGAAFAPSLADTVRGRTDAPIGVDIPVGLMEHGRREADVLAARLIGARRRSVFAIPPRAVWEQPDFSAANRRCRELTGGGLTRQAWGLRERILEANSLRNAGTARIYEVHPEVSFRAMAGAPLPHSKTTWAGQAMRRTLLARAGIVLPDDLGRAGRARPDDVLDAAAAAWTAHRIATGQAASLPNPPQTNEHGNQVAIWY